jgi:hypothetical protein
MGLDGAEANPFRTSNGSSTMRRSPFIRLHDSSANSPRS